MKQIATTVIILFFPIFIMSQTPDGRIPILVDDSICINGCNKIEYPDCDCLITEEPNDTDLVNVITKKIILSAWVHEDYNSPPITFNNTSITVSYIDMTFEQITNNGILFDDNLFVLPANSDLEPTGPIIDDWQRIVGIIEVPQYVEIFKVQLNANGSSETNSYFDDIRFYPYNGTMKSFVYDKNTQRLMAELDENNYATFYEYDLEGGLVRVKKETEEGIYTIQETRSSTRKTD